MTSGTFSFFCGDSLRVENESKISFETLVFHNINFLSNDRSFDVAAIIFSDGPWRLEFKLCSLSSQKEIELSATNMNWHTWESLVVRLENMNMISQTTFTKYKWHLTPLNETPHENFLRMPLLAGVNWQQEDLTVTWNLQICLVLLWIY